MKKILSNFFDRFHTKLAENIPALSLKPKKTVNDLRNLDRVNILSRVKQFFLDLSHTQDIKDFPTIEFENVTEALDHMHFAGLSYASFFMLHIVNLPTNEQRLHALNQLLNLHNQYQGKLKAFEHNTPVTELLPPLNPTIIAHMQPDVYEFLVTNGLTTEELTPNFFAVPHNFNENIRTIIHFFLSENFTQEEQHKILSKLFLQEQEENPELFDDTKLVMFIVNHIIENLGDDSFYIAITLLDKGFCYEPKKLFYLRKIINLFDSLSEPKNIQLLSALFMGKNADNLVPYADLGHVKEMLEYIADTPTLKASLYPLIVRSIAVLHNEYRDTLQEKKGDNYLDFADYYENCRQELYQKLVQTDRDLIDMGESEKIEIKDEEFTFWELKILLEFMQTYVRCEILKLNNINIGGDEGASVIASMINNSNISRLVLKNTELTSQGVTALAKSLETNIRLRSLVLDNNNIGLDGATALAEALKTNKTLRKLSLENCNIPDKGIELIFDAILSSNRTEEFTFPSFSPEQQKQVTAYIRQNSRAPEQQDDSHKFRRRLEEERAEAMDITTVQK